MALESSNAAMLKRLLIVLVAVTSTGCRSSLTAPEGDASSWGGFFKRQFGDAYKQIKADLDFHESEGLDAFDPTASSYVRQARKDMTGQSFR